MNNSEDTRSEQSEFEEEIVLKKIVSPANLQTVLKPYFGMIPKTEAESVPGLANCAVTTNARLEVAVDPDYAKKLPKYVTKCKFRAQKVRIDSEKVGK